MTSNDKQIDVLMRRHAKAAPRASSAGHLDADELSAFADGALPPATRALYVSHLADCDDCRKQASALAISSGAIVRTEQSHGEIREGRTFLQALVGLFALPVLRYAAFAAVLLIVAGVAFIALRRPSREPSLVALNEPANDRRESAVKPPATLRENAGANKQANAETRSAPPSPLVGGKDHDSKAGTTVVAEDAPVNPQPAKEVAAAPPVTVEKKADQGVVTKALPSYAPAPPGESATAAQQKQQAYENQQRIAGISGPRQQQKVESVDKLQTQERDREALKDVARADEPARKGIPNTATTQMPASPRRAGDEKAKGPMRNMENNSNIVNRNENVGRVELSKTAPSAGSDGRRPAEESSQTRSVGGRKFRRQGNAWVDQKFKSSMTLKGITRGSDEFANLDSGLRSIAQQLGGEIIVVWKGKAYLIK